MDTKIKIELIVQNYEIKVPKRVILEVTQTTKTQNMNTQITIIIQITCQLGIMVVRNTRFQIIMLVRVVIISTARTNKVVNPCAEQNIRMLTRGTSTIE